MGCFLNLQAAFVRGGEMSKERIGLGTGSSPIFPLRSHSFLYIKKYLFIVVIGTILSKELEFTYRYDRFDCAYVCS